MLIQFMTNLQNSSKNFKPFNFIINKNIIEIIEILNKKKLIEYDIDFKNHLGIFQLKNTKIEKIEYITKPSRKIFIKHKELKKIGYFCILSTNSGLLTKEEAIELGLGGILLLKIKYCK